MAKKAANLHLTDGVVKRRCQAPDRGNKIYYDDEVAGFGARVTSNGARSYILNYYIHGRERRFTIGEAGAWTATAARKEARRLKHLVDSGHDPLSEREAERAAPTMVELLDRFEQEHLTRKRASTAADYERMLRVHIRPFFGNHTKVADVAFTDIDRLHRKITKAGSPRRANTVVAVLSKAFNLATRWGMRPDGTNPTKGLERNGEVKRKRYLSGDELVRLCKALAKHSDKEAADIIRLLLLTGCRRGEALAMRWADVDLAAQTWNKPASSTKTGIHHTVPLSAPACQLLAQVRQRRLAGKGRSLGEFVFPGPGETGHRVEIKRDWRQLTKAASLDNLRLHDLRHSFASQLVSGGSTLALIGQLLGHASVVTTERYSHLALDPQRVAVERIGATLEAATNGKPTSAPVDIPTGKRQRVRRG
jgi:integrase